jgi:hypothetical protein
VRACVLQCYHNSSFSIQVLYLFLAVPLQVNFSYSEAGENKQALVKLVTCERLVDFC